MNFRGEKIHHPSGKDIPHYEVWEEKGEVLHGRKAEKFGKKETIFNEYPFVIEEGSSKNAARKKVHTK